MITSALTPARRSTRLWRRVTRLDAAGAAVWYTLLTLALTWPACTSLTTRIPADLGDPLFASWLLQWNFDHLLDVARGDLGAIGRYWNANIFHPAPLALLYAEHLFALGVQSLPVWVATGDLLLCYNLLLLSTFVLSGLGTFLFVRELTGNPRAAFVAGLVYAFTPYRFAQLGHIQVLSSQWMPFVLFGLRRYFDRLPRPLTRVDDAVGARAVPPSDAARRVVPLAGAALALVAQNLSCGYYLVFFAPVVAAYVLWEVGRRGLWRNRGMWLQLGAAAAGVGAACLPFLLKYYQLRSVAFAPRPLDELRAFSADTYAYLRGIDELWLWPGGFTDYNKAEGQLFPGVFPVVLAVVGLACLVAALRRRSLGASPLQGWRVAAAAPVAVVGVAALELARFELFAGRRIWRIRETWPWLANIHHVLLVVAVCGGLLLVLSARARRAARLALSSGRAFFAVLFALAVWLSFGPLVTTIEHGIAPNSLYAWLYWYVPGFNGLRVPARYGMLALLFLAILCGYGAVAIEKLARRRGKLALAVAMALVVLEGAAMPVSVRAIEWKRKDGGAGAVSARDMDRLYDFLRRMPRGTVVAEFPFGDPQGEIRAVYLSARHRHPIVNGYSGGFPPGYGRTLELLFDPLGTGDPAWQAILDSGATCLVVHQWAFEGGNGGAFSDWLQSHGAMPIATFRGDRIFQVPR